MVSREDANFDRACDNAWAAALSLFGVDTDGYFMAISPARRDVILCVKFDSYRLCSSMGGPRHTYYFTAKVVSDS